MGNYKDLDIYGMAFEFAVRIHHFSLKLPGYELYEQGSQIRRSSKRIKDCIAEGYGRKRYKADYIKFLTYAHASCDETINHLETIKRIHKTEGMDELIEAYDTLGRKINKYIEYVDKNWRM